MATEVKVSDQMAVVNKFAYTWTIGYQHWLGPEQVTQSVSDWQSFLEGNITMNCLAFCQAVLGLMGDQSLDTIPDVAYALVNPEKNSRLTELLPTAPRLILVGPSGVDVSKVQLMPLSVRQNLELSKSWAGYNPCPVHAGVEFPALGGGVLHLSNRGVRFESLERMMVNYGGRYEKVYRRD